MFLQAGCATPEIVAKAAKAGLKFLRVGINAGDGAKAVDAVKMVKAAGMKAFFAMMKAYVLSPEELAKEAQLLEAAGVDVII
ncbi:MAG: 4-hydroxy-2-oxovalerate aldolase, partial [Firmicutes bacterium]|nr:4-hydroxy-2-oxovalerate aldolase [Bacillota bacterium]